MANLVEQHCTGLSGLFIFIEKKLEQFYFDFYKARAPIRALKWRENHIYGACVVIAAAKAFSK